MNEVFTEKRLIEKIDELAQQVENEIIYQIERFNALSSYGTWQENIEELKQLISVRRELTFEHLQEVFSLDESTMAVLFD